MREAIVVREGKVGDCRTCGLCVYVNGYEYGYGVKSTVVERMDLSGPIKRLGVLQDDYLSQTSLI